MEQFGTLCHTRQRAVSLLINVRKTSTNEYPTIQYSKRLTLSTDRDLVLIFLCALLINFFCFIIEWKLIFYS